MTISLVVFVSLQLYWIKELYTSLEQDFSNKVYSALETSTQKINQIEVNKYWNETYNNVGKEVLASKNQPTKTFIQQSSDSANRSNILFQTSIVEKQNIPVSAKGDTLYTTKLYKDEGQLKLKRSNPEPLTTNISRDLDNNSYQMKEFARLSATNLPIEKRVDSKTIDSVISKELRLKGIDTKFGFGVINKALSLIHI